MEAAEKLLALMYQRTEKVIAIIYQKRATDTCSCSNCQRAIEEAGSGPCSVCGFAGSFVALDCACYDTRCHGGKSRGAGCWHGIVTCPVCEGGDAEFDIWATLREIRAAVTGAADGDAALPSNPSLVQRSMTVAAQGTQATAHPSGPRETPAPAPGDLAE